MNVNKNCDKAKKKKVECGKAHLTLNKLLFVIDKAAIDHFRIVSIRPGWAHSQRRVGVNITIPLQWPSCEWTLTLPIFLVFVRYQQ